MKSRLVRAAVALILGVAPLVAPFGTSASAQTASAQAELRSATFTVENMTCALCPVTVKRAMEGVEGVQSVQIDFEARTATVVFDPAVATPEAIGAASADAGYPASVKG